MIAVLPQNPLCFFVQPRLYLCTGIQPGPNRTLNLKVDADLISGNKGCLRRTKRMIPDMVESMVFADLKNLLPCLHIHGRVTREGKCSRIMRSPKMNRSVVKYKLSTLSPKFPDANGQTAGIIDTFALQFQNKLMEFWIKLIPQLCVIA